MVIEDARLDVVLPDGPAGADEPEARPVVGQGRAVEVVPVAGRPAVEDRPPAVGRPPDVDAVGTDGLGSRSRVLDPVEGVAGRFSIG